MTNLQSLQMRLDGHHSKRTKLTVIAKGTNGQSWQKVFIIWHCKGDLCVAGLMATLHSESHYQLYNLQAFLCAANKHI